MDRSAALVATLRAELEAARVSSESRVRGSTPVECTGVGVAVHGVSKKRVTFEEPGGGEQSRSGASSYPARRWERWPQSDNHRV